MLISHYSLLLLLVQNENDPTSLFGWRRVVPVEELFEIISEVQCNEKGHIRYMTRKTYIFPQNDRSGNPRVANGRSAFVRAEISGHPC